MNKQQSQNLLLKVDLLTVFLLIFATDNELLAQGEERETTSSCSVLVFSRL